VIFSNKRLVGLPLRLLRVRIEISLALAHLLELVLDSGSSFPAEEVSRSSYPISAVSDPGIGSSRGFRRRIQYTRHMIRFGSQIRLFVRVDSSCTIIANRLCRESASCESRSSNRKPHIKPKIGGKWSVPTRRKLLSSNR
jgi:hypothetical protein